MIGAMRQKVILQRRSNVTDAGGGVSVSWTDVAALWAEITPLTGNESVQAMRVQPVQNYLVRLRRREDVTPDDRLMFGSRVLEIKSITNVNQRGHWMQCRCQEGVAG